MVSNENSDDDRNEENQNNSQEITLAQSSQQMQKSNVLGLDNDLVSLLPTLSKYLLKNYCTVVKLASDIKYYLP